MLAAATVACGPWNSAKAFDFFGLWGSDEKPPPVSPSAISYAVTVDVGGVNFDSDSVWKSRQKDQSVKTRSKRPTSSWMVKDAKPTASGG